MKVVEVRDEAGFGQLRDKWDRLLSRVTAPSIFLTWEWMSAWWSAYGEERELRILVVIDEGGEVRGIAPLRNVKVRRYGQSLGALAFVGDGSNTRFPNDSDYLDVIAETDYEKPVVQALMEHCARDVRGGVALLNEVPDTSPNLPILREVLRGKGIDWTESDMPCAAVRLPASWDEYLRMLQPRFRTKVRTALRNLESRPEVRVGFCETPAEVERLLPILFDLHARRWGREGRPGVFGSEQKRKFYFALSSLLLERQWLRFSWLEWKGRVLACQFGFVYGETYFHLQEGYDPDTEHWSPGIALRAWSMREFVRQGLKQYDFLGGFNRHKSDWGAEVKYSKRIVAAGGWRGNLVFRWLPQWETAARESLSKMLPERVLQWRKRLLQPPGSADPWLRRSAAACYFHGGLGGITRPLRERYQLRVAGGRKLALEKRTQACARILYYHRVNDDGDPFGAAISTRMFEQHIRYLSRHYKVVPLREIMRHLTEGGAPELLVGITFDDGYADNYRNAFPILRRYGLPATIFLTTGGLDTREPLWFETLANAIRHTSRDYIDLEIDIPRRFWTRTLAERVASNTGIFRLLRTLDNEQRLCWLPRILSALGSNGSLAQSDHMLTWDEVRLMNSQGIDFGGHTVTHPFLSKLSPEAMAWEVSECKRRIEEEVQQPADLFAYPNGRSEDFAPENKEMLLAAGYRAAVTTIWGINDQSTDRMELRRGGPWEDSAALFAAKLDWYQWVNQ